MIAVVALAEALGVERPGIPLASHGEWTEPAHLVETTPLFLTRTLALSKARPALPVAALALLAVGVLFFIFIMKPTSHLRPAQNLVLPRPLRAGAESNPEPPPASSAPAGQPPSEKRAPPQQTPPAKQLPRLPPASNAPRQQFPGIY
jgi:hypothetical protein